MTTGSLAAVHGVWRLSCEPSPSVLCATHEQYRSGRNGGPRPVIDESKLWFKQAFADITLMKGADGKENSLVMRLGRQEFFFGSGRLVDPREGPNVRQAFDGIALIRKKASWDVRAFARSLF